MGLGGHPNIYRHLAPPPPSKEDAMEDFRKDLTALLNRYSKENESDTPDWVLAHYLLGCLEVWAEAVTAREKWHGRKLGSLRRRGVDERH